MHPNVLSDLEKLVDELPMILDQLKAMPSISNSITPELWEEFKVATVEACSSSNKTGVLEVVSAFQTPKLVYDLRRKQYQVIEQQRPILGNAEDKVRLCCFHDFVIWHTDINSNRSIC